MAVIGKNSETVFRIRKFTGLNECPSGDAGLAWGEAAEMRNFRITREGSLQLRPGTRTQWTFDGPVEGLWSGFLGGETVKVAAAGGQLWRLGAPGEARSVGRIGPGRCVFFPFGDRLYLLTPKRYMVWTGHGRVTDVAGYRPVVSVSVPPEGGGTLLEAVNKLTGARRAFFSPDGTGRVFQLPERELSSVDYAVRRADGEHLPFACDLAAGTVTFDTAPGQGANALEIGWTKGSGDRGTVVGMRYAELYSGQTENRVFLYGDGTNRAVYSGIDYDGRPDPTYFPDLNVLTAGSADTPITGMARHFTRLLLFKPDGAYSVQTGSVTLENGVSIPAFYVLPIHREAGNEAMGQVTLVDNDPRTLWRGGVYRWRSQSGYLTLDERSAGRISQRVEESLAGMDLQNAVAFDDQARREWYLCDGEVALVHNYDVDAWYRYEGFPARCMGVLDGALYLGTADGALKEVTRAARTDDGAAIDALWRSGSMAFDRQYAKKLGKWLWVAMKPESGGCVTVTARSDRRSLYPAVPVRAGLISYSHADYRHWSYSSNRQPRIARVRMPVKGAAYEQLVLAGCAAGETATVLGVEGTVRYGRWAK